MSNYLQDQELREQETASLLARLNGIIETVTKQGGNEVWQPPKNISELCDGVEHFIGIYHEASHIRVRVFGHVFVETLNCYEDRKQHTDS